MRYVTYDEQGNLTGCFLQDVLPEHANHILVDEEQAREWVKYRAVEAEVQIGEVDGEPIMATVCVLDLAPPAEPAPPAVPAAVTMRQARLALHATAAGAESGFTTMLQQVEATVAGMAGADGDKARIEWEFSSEVRRQQPLVLAVAPVLGLSEQQLDDLFILAATL